MDYFRSVGRLTADYSRAVIGTADAARRTVRTARAARPTATAARGAAPTIALEAEAGSTALGMFVVENSGSSPVSGEIQVPPLRDADGHQTQPEVSFEPQRVHLGPGEQTVVQISVAIDRTLEPGVDYRGAVRVPGTPGTEIPIVVRRVAGERRRAPRKTPTS